MTIKKAYCLSTWWLSPSWSCSWSRLMSSTWRSLMSIFEPWNWGEMTEPGLLGLGEMVRSGPVFVFPPVPALWSSSLWPKWSWSCSWLGWSQFTGSCLWSNFWPFFTPTLRPSLIKHCCSITDPVKIKIIWKIMKNYNIRVK